MLKSRKRLAQDVVCTSAMYEGLVHDVTDSQTQNGSAHSHVFATFTQVNFFNKPDHKINQLKQKK